MVWLWISFLLGGAPFSPALLSMFSDVWRRKPVLLPWVFCAGEGIRDDDAVFDHLPLTTP